MAKLRFDQRLVDLGLADTKSKAQSLIEEGYVSVNGKLVCKPGKHVSMDADIQLAGESHPWVSRGGLKLEKVIAQFAIDVSGMTAIDVGASTGGFTDVLLTHGAAKVYAVDVGHGQLDCKLRSDERVVVLEKTNARYLSEEQIPEPIDMIVCDASFIGLQTVLPAALALTKPQAHLATLIKPQFEVGREQVGKSGVVRDEALHAEVCERIEAWVGGLEGWQVVGVTESPITGPKGNKEFLLYAQKGGTRGA